MSSLINMKAHGINNCRIAIAFDVLHDAQMINAWITLPILTQPAWNQLESAMMNYFISVYFYLYHKARVEVHIVINWYISKYLYNIPYFFITYYCLIFIMSFIFLNIFINSITSYFSPHLYSVKLFEKFVRFFTKKVLRRPVKNRKTLSIFIFILVINFVIRLIKLLCILYVIFEFISLSNKIYEKIYENQKQFFSTAFILFLYLFLYYTYMLSLHLLI